jgi:hypothetical protein
MHFGAWLCAAIKTYYFLLSKSDWASETRTRAKAGILCGQRKLAYVLSICLVFEKA